jgi:hypothetical protein
LAPFWENNLILKPRVGFYIEKAFLSAAPAPCLHQLGFRLMTSPLQQKIKITGPVVITANRVGDGAVVYWRGEGGWTTDLGEAAVTTDVAIARALVQAAAADDLNAVGSYIAPVRVTSEGEVQPGNLREIIRRTGPTIDLPVSFGI